MRLEILAEFKKDTLHLEIRERAAVLDALLALLVAVG
jgi:hypothetical protein